MTKPTMEARGLRRRTSMLIRDSRHTFLGVKKRRDGKVMLFRYMWYFDRYSKSYKFEHWTIHHDSGSTIEIEEYPTVNMLTHGIKGFLGLQVFKPGIGRRGDAVPY